MPTRLDRGAVGFYLALSWSAVVAIKPLAATLPATALALIVAGGLIYSAGVPFYVWRSLKFQNAIWHACVALGAALPVRRRGGGDRRAILTPQSDGVLMRRHKSPAYSPSLFLALAACGLVAAPACAADLPNQTRRRCPRSPPIR